mmetsp:Transcript_20804/g.35732  ORF Transcript_20804/g.35732 Transcript_20804/m.35732 type:complete len:289 (+) Transcript_20804:862-1728(+)
MIVFVAAGMANISGVLVVVVVCAFFLLFRTRVASILLVQSVAIPLVAAPFIVRTQHVICGGAQRDMRPVGGNGKAGAEEVGSGSSVEPGFGGDCALVLHMVRNARFRHEGAGGGEGGGMRREEGALQARVVASKVALPVAQHAPRHQVTLVEDEEHGLGKVMHDVRVQRRGEMQERTTRIDHVQQDVTSLAHAPQLAPHLEVVLEVVQFPDAVCPVQPPQPLIEMRAFRVVQLLRRCACVPLRATWNRQRLHTRTRPQRHLILSNNGNSAVFNPFADSIEKLRLKNSS